MNASSITRRTLLAAAALGGAGTVGAMQAERRPWPRGRPTPAVALPALDGTPWSLAGEHGRVVALNFWASWCEPCRAEMPSLELMAERHAGDALRVVAVNFKESAAAIGRFVDRAAVTLPVVRDTDGSAARAFGVGLFPTTVLIGRDGRAVFSVIGEADWQAEPVRGWVAALLGAASEPLRRGASPAPSRTPSRSVSQSASQTVSQSASRSVPAPAAPTHSQGGSR